MERAEALEIVVAKTGHRRFRDLVDPDHPDYAPAYWGAILAIADGTAGETTGAVAPAPQGCGGASPTPAEHLANIAQVKRCPSWEATSSCGCGFNRCLAGKGREPDSAVCYDDCFKCLEIGEYKKADSDP